MLALAHTISEQMVCPGCGMPKHEAYNPDSAGWYVVEDYTCQGCAAVTRDAKAHDDHQPERKVVVIDERPRDVPLKPMPERKRGAR